MRKRPSWQWVALLLAVVVVVASSIPVAAFSDEEQQPRVKIANAQAVVRIYVHRQAATNRNNNDHDQVVLEHRHNTCHLEYDHDNTTTITTTDLQAACCRSMFSASAAALGPSGSSSTLLVVDDCLVQSAVVPPLEVLLFADAPHDTTTSPQRQRKKVQVSWTQTHRMPVDTPAFLRKVFVWDSTGYLTDGEWLDLSPQHKDKIQKAIERGLLPPGNLLGVTNNHNNNDNNRVPVELVSTLSESGGMHRLMTHKLTIGALSRQQEQQSPPPSEQLQVNAWIYLWVPETMFLDVEDVIEYRNNNDDDHNHWNVYNATIMTHHNSMIDMEQPAMASPQHVVLLHIQASVVATTTHDDERLPPLVIATKWHTRYPNPINNNHDDDKYRLILISPPLLAGGSVHEKHNGGMQYSPAPVVSLSEPLLVWVAAAPAQDFAFVAIVTVLCSIAGAMLVAFQMHTHLQSKLE